MTDRWRPPLLLPGEKSPRSIPAWMLWLAVAMTVAAVVVVAALVT